jgi:hypothetical protein
MEWIEIFLYGIFGVGLLFVAGLLFLLCIPFKLFLNGQWVESKWEGEWILQYLFWTISKSSSSDSADPNLAKHEVSPSPNASEETESFTPNIQDVSHSDGSIYQNSKAPPPPLPPLPMESKIVHNPQQRNSKTAYSESIKNNASVIPLKPSFKMRIKTWIASKVQQIKMQWNQSWYPFLRAWAIECLKNLTLWRKIMSYTFFCIWKAKNLLAIKIDTLKIQWGEKRPGDLAEWLPLTYSAMAVLPENTGFSLELDWRPQKRRNVWVRAIIEHRPIMLFHWLNLCMIHFPYWTCIVAGFKSYQKLNKNTKTP